MIVAGLMLLMAICALATSDLSWDHCMTCGAVACPDTDICPDCLLMAFDESGADVASLEPPEASFDDPS